MRTLKPEYVRQDERGRLVQITSGTWRQVNLLDIKKNNKFGGHYHKEKEEIFYVVRGHIFVEIYNTKHNETLHKHFVAGQMFIVHPFDKHTIEAMEDTIIVEVLSKPFSQEDTYEK